MVEMIKHWDGDCKLVYGRPRYPQSQGLIEQANGTVEKMIAAAMEQFQTKEWSKILPRIQINLNTSKPSSTKIMPFEVFLNKKPNFGSKKEFFEFDKNGEEKPCQVQVNQVEQLNQVNSTEFSEEEEELEESDKENDATASELKNEIITKRNTLNLNNAKSREIMVKKHDHKRNKKTIEFKIMDVVTVKIPRIDRGGTDFNRLPGVICKMSDHQEKFYQVLTPSGILADRYRASDLEPYCGIVNVSLENYQKRYKVISLREAAILQSASTGSIEEVDAICNCGTVCKGDNRC